MWRKLKQRMRQRIAEGIRHKVTALGVMMVTLLLASGLLSFTTSQNVFYLLFSLLLSSILISSFVNRLMLAGLEIRVVLPEHACASEVLDCTLTIRNTKSWLSSFALELAFPAARHFYIPCIAAAGAAEVGFSATWMKRGVPEPIAVELSTRFPFGFSKRRTRVLVRVPQAIYPAIRAQAGFDQVLDLVERRAAVVAGAPEREFSHLREYAPGESARDIAWKQSARSLTPVVKHHLQEGEGKLRLLLDLGSPAFETLVEVAAYLVWELCYKNLQFVFIAGGDEIAVAGRSDAYTVLRILAVARMVEQDLAAHDPSFLVLSFRPGYLSLPANTGPAGNPAGAHERNDFRTN